MSAVYSNKFIVSIGDVVRVKFVDERGPIAQGLPMEISLASEIVMTIANFELFLDVGNKLMKDRK